MSKLDREAIFKRGASFYKEGETVYFQFQADASSKVVAKATDAHKAEHPLAWKLYLEEAFNGADPAKFDHDGDGEIGGSLPKPPPVQAAPKRGRPRKTP